MNGRMVAAIAGIGLVLWYLVKRYTSDPLAAPSVIGLAPANPPTFSLLAADKVKPIAQPAFPYTDVAGDVANLPSPSVWPETPPLPAVPDSVEAYDAIWSAETPEGTAVRIATVTGEGFTDMRLERGYLV